MVQPAVDGIFAAFKTHSLVGLGEFHEISNALAFYATLVRDPRFASEVGNVVVEFGASQHQDILDRYMAGEEVPYSELSKVWRNTVAWQPTLGGVGYQTFFAQVRAVNLSLPPDRRIHVLLSEPPIDWGSVNTKEAWQQIYDRRAAHAADQILRKILEPGKKALVIYGVGHFFSSPWPSTLPIPPGGTATLGEIVERTHPDAFYVVTIYAGFEQRPGCTAALEARFKWPKSVLIAPIRNTSLQAVLMQRECAPMVRGIEPPIPADELQRLEKRYQEINMGVAGNALLFLAPASELMRTPADPTQWMDLDYAKELNRRIRVRGYSPLPFDQLVPLVAAPPRPWTRFGP